MQIDRARQRLEHGADDDDGGNRVEKTADHQEHEGNEEADPDRAEAPGGNVGQEGLRDLVVGEQPPECAGRADAE